MFGVTLSVVLVVALLIAAYMAWNIGANDVANAMGTSVGSGALTLKRAIIVAAVFEFGGAVLFGSHVTDTIRKGVLDFGTDELSYELSQQLMYGFMAALLSAAILLTIATKYGLPISTTHVIVGGVIGMGMWIQADSVNWDKVSGIVISWVVSPLIGGLLAYGTFSVIKRVILNHDDPLQQTKRMAPILALPTFFVLGLALQFKALKGFFAKAQDNGWIEDTGCRRMPGRPSTRFPTEHGFRSTACSSPSPSVCSPAWCCGLCCAATNSRRRAMPGSNGCSSGCR